MTRNVNMSAAKAHILLCIKNLMAKRYWSVPLKNTHIVKARADAIFSGKVYTVYFTRSHHICPGKTLGVPSNKESTSLFFFFSLSLILYPTTTTTTTTTLLPSYRKSKQPLCFPSGALPLLENKSKPFLFWWCSLICVDEPGKREGLRPERWGSLGQWEAGTPSTRSNTGLLLVVTGLPLARQGAALTAPVSWRVGILNTVIIMFIKT